MNYRLELYDNMGGLIYSARTETPERALVHFGEYITMHKMQAIEVRTATCYLNQDPVWEFELK